jgi:hypothetical protein|tara:strand:+ start:1567 stop:1950 length:384 start_codon:yes stop_codon:yes gene_type:complete
MQQIFIGIILVLGFSTYTLYNQNKTLATNNQLLESSIAQQNEAIKQHLENAKQLQDKNNKLASQSQDSLREVNKLRSTFANHDLDALALAKPGLVEIKVNKAVKRLKDELVEITDPTQFDDEEDSDS